MTRPQYRLTAHPSRRFAFATLAVIWAIEHGLSAEWECV